MRKNNAVSAVIGVILMVAITIAIAATVFYYVKYMTPMTADEAIAKAHDCVKQELNTTATLQFGNDTVTQDGTIWHISGNVSKINPIVQYAYVVSLTDNGDRTWTVNSCTVTPTVDN